MKRLLCRLFAVMALVTGIVTPSAGLAFADPSIDTTVVPVPTVPPVQVQPPVAPVIPTPGVGPPVAPVPPVPPAPPQPVVIPPAPVPVPAPQPVPQPAPVITPVVPNVVPQQVPVPQPVPTQSAPMPVVEQPPVVPKPVPQPSPISSLPAVVPPVQQPKPVITANVPAPPVAQVPPVKPEVPQVPTVDRPVPPVPPVAVDTGPSVPANQPPPLPAGNPQLPPSGGSNEVAPVEGNASVVVPHDAGVGSRSANPLPEGAVQTGPAINQNITNTSIDAPRQLPPPTPSNPFPSWGYNPPVQVQPVPFPGHNGQQGGGPCNTPSCNNNPGPGGGNCGTPPCGNPGPPGGNCGTPPCGGPGPGNGNCGTPPCGPGPGNGNCGTPPCSPGPCGTPPCSGPPPPIIPDYPVYNPWQNGNHQLPPPNPNIFVHGGDNGQVVFVNNVTQVNNTVINNTPTVVYLTNFATNRVLSFNTNYGTPYSLSPGWCGGLGGSWGWSASVNILGFGASFAGGGAFNVGAGCGYIPPPVPINPLPIYSPGYAPVYASNYFEPQGCGCVYADNTYLYGNYQQVPIQGVPQQVFVPTSYTPDIVFQQPTEGLPPFMTGDDPVQPTSWFAKQPAMLWVSVGIVMLGLMGLAYINRQRLISMFG